MNDTWYDKLDDEDLISQFIERATAFRNAYRAIHKRPHIKLTYGIAFDPVEITDWATCNYPLEEALSITVKKL